MSHQPERKDKDCLNCGTIVQGKYCHVCGQENIVPHQGFWSLAKHFVFDILHFDGKFFETLKYLFIKPGKVSRDYVMGKRAHYLDPIRMYLFTSAIFFLVFFSVKHIDKDINFGISRMMSASERNTELALLQSKNADSLSSIEKKKYNLLQDTSKKIWLIEIMDSTDLDDSTVKVQLDNKNFALKGVSSSIRNNKPATSWLGKQIEKKSEKINKTYGEDDNKFLQELLKEFLHRLPYLLFVSLPLFALILKLLYIRQKRFFYSDHAIFTLHHYIFSFVILLIYLGLSTLAKWSGYGIFNSIAGWLFLVWAIYLFVGMKNFYGQSIKKTLGKFFLLNLLGIISLIFLFGVFLLYTLAQF